MKQEEIIEMANKAFDESSFTDAEVLRFAKLVAEKAIKEALAQPEQEPVAWIYRSTGALFDICPNDADEGEFVPLYTTPPQRKPLTDEQIDNAMAENKQTLIDAADNYWKMRRAYARIIEAAHGIKE